MPFMINVTTESSSLSNMSFVTRKHVFTVFNQVLHKLGSTATEDGWRLEILGLGSIGIVLS